MKRIISVAIGSALVVLISLFLYFSFKEDHASQPHNIANDSSEEVVIVNGKTLKKPYISPARLKSWKKEWDAKMAKEDAKFSEELSNMTINMDLILESQRLGDITQEDLLEVKAMLSKFQNLDSMSKSNIIDTLLSFYASDHRFPGMRELYVNTYNDLEKFYGNNLTKNQKLHIMVHFTQDKVSSLRLIDTEVLEKRQLREELLKSDPDLYYDTELENIALEIPETEALISAAEVRGDMESAEAHRNHLEALRERIDSLDFERNFDDHIEAMKQELIKERLPNVESDYHDWVKDLIDKTDLDKSSDKSPIISDESKSPVNVDSRSSLNSVLLPVGEKYFDVVMSLYFTPQEFDKFYPTANDRAILNKRTEEMQGVIVSEVRKVLGNMKGVSDTEKIKMATEFLNKNYDKDFASDIIKRLNNSED